MVIAFKYVLIKNISKKLIFRRKLINLPKILIKKYENHNS